MNGPFLPMSRFSDFFSYKQKSKPHCAIYLAEFSTCAKFHKNPLQTYYGTPNLQVFTKAHAMDQRLPYLHEFVHVQRICMKHCIFTKVGITIGSMEMVFLFI